MSGQADPQRFDERNAVPIVDHASPWSFDPLSGPDVARHDMPVGDDLVLKTLVDRRHQSDVLIVSLHGSLPREKYTLPRFERRVLFDEAPHPVLYVADPGIERADDMRLGWYVGTEDADLTSATVEVAIRVRKALGARHTLYLGTSAGGFASMRMATMDPASAALAFSPQTTISNYYPGPRDRFLRNLWPHLGEGAEACESIGVRQSLIETFAGSSSEDSMFWYVQNRNDPFHITNHCKPFARAFGLPLKGGETADARWRLTWIDSQKGHGPPSVEMFADHVEQAIAWVRDVGRRSENPAAAARA